MWVGGILLINSQIYQDLWGHTTGIETEISEFQLEPSTY